MASHGGFDETPTFARASKFQIDNTSKHMSLVAVARSVRDDKSTQTNCVDAMASEGYGTTMLTLCIVRPCQNYASGSLSPHSQLPSRNVFSLECRSK